MDTRGLAIPGVRPRISAAPTIHAFGVGKVSLVARGLVQPCGGPREFVVVVGGLKRWVGGWNEVLDVLYGCGGGGWGRICFITL